MKIKPNVPLLMALVLLSACTTSKPVLTTEIKTACPLYLQAPPLPEPIAPKDAFVDESAKLFLAGEYFPWAKSNAEKLKMAREWCAQNK